MLPYNFTIEIKEKEIIIEALNYFLEDLEEERKSFSSASEVINSGIMDGINCCRDTLKAFNRNSPLTGQNVYDIYSALSAYLEFSDIFISNSNAQSKNYALDLRKNIKAVLTKLKPVYDYLMSEHNEK